jgi:hypothetical protein
MLLDPLDTGEPSRKRWEEFRAQFASAFLLYTVVHDLAYEVEEGVRDLSSRLLSSILDYPPA